MCESVLLKQPWNSGTVSYSLRDGLKTHYIPSALTFTAILTMSLFLRYCFATAGYYRCFFSSVKTGLNAIIEWRKTIFSREKLSVKLS